MSSARYVSPVGRMRLHWEPLCGHGGQRVASFDFPPGGAAPSDPASGREAREADFNSALLREQHRALARLGPYVLGVVILVTPALYAMTGRTSSLLGQMVLPAALLALLLSRVISRFNARGRVERERLDVVRREIRAASVLGPGLAFLFSLAAAVSTRHAGALELSLALLAIWIAAAACAFCLNALAGAANLVVVAAAAPLVVACLSRGDELSLWLSAVLTFVSFFLIRMLSENFRVFAEIVRSRFAIAEQQRAAEDARKAAMVIALTDDLTGLANRRCFQGLLAEKIRAGKESGARFAVGIIDLDDFKPVNDNHGHPVGDETLRQFAARLAQAMAGRGSAARIGGDEFAILCDGIGGRDEAIAFGVEIQAMFATPFAVEAFVIPLTSACGFALFPSSAAEPDELVRLADAALYRAKACGPGGVAVFHVAAESDAVGRATLEDALRRAVAELQIGVFFEPIVDLTTGRISGFEALARWNDATLGAIAPSVFLPVAERIGVIDELWRDLLRKAAIFAAQWPSDLTLSLNLSQAQLARSTTALRIVSALKEFGLPPTRFEVEVSEAEIVKNFAAARTTIEALRTAGVRVALDHLGAGALSLAQMRDLAIDKVKIDKSFIAKVCCDPKIATLTRAIVDMCRRLGLACVADGIEHQEQLDELRFDGCAGGQGALFASAMPGAMVTEFIKEQRSRAA
jgi:diguanylate cyclase (GGDEF)-like protein